MLEFSWPAFWFTVVNFLLLVGLLYKFLHKPLLDALDKRKQEIEEAMNRAEEKAREADTAKEKYERETAALNEEREKVLSDVRRESEAAQEQVLAEARKSGETEVANLKRDWERQRREASESLQQEVVETSLEVTRQLLMKLAGTDVEDRLREWRQAEVDRYLAGHGVDDQTPVRVITAKPLPEEEQHRLTEKLSGGKEQREIRFEIDEALIAGARIEFSAAAVDASLAAVLAEIRAQANEKPKADDKEGSAT